MYSRKARHSGLDPESRICSRPIDSGLRRNDESICLCLYIPLIGGNSKPRPLGGDFYEIIESVPNLIYSSNNQIGEGRPDNNIAIRGIKRT